MSEPLRWTRSKAGLYRIGDVAECHLIDESCWYWVVRFGTMHEEGGVCTSCREAKRDAEKALAEMTTK